LIAALFPCGGACTGLDITYVVFSDAMPKQKMLEEISNNATRRAPEWGPLPDGRGKGIGAMDAGKSGVEAGEYTLWSRRIRVERPSACAISGHTSNPRLDQVLHLNGVLATSGGSFALSSRILRWSRNKLRRAWCGFWYVDRQEDSTKAPHYLYVWYVQRDIAEQRPRSSIVKCAASSRQVC
jgi:hypothetical protein